MDEIEHRLAALELLAIEALAELTDDQRQAIAMRLVSGEALDRDARVIRAQAQALLGDAMRRHALFLGGVRVKPEAND